MSVKNSILEAIETILLSLIIITVIYGTIASVEVVWGSSMEPNFHTGERILVDKITKYFDELNRGEIVVIVPPTDSRHYIKRVIGIPGDIIKIFDCKITVFRDGNKFILEESYLENGICTMGGINIAEGRSLRLGDDDFVVMGDNRVNSVDSRSFGVIGKKNVVGRVIFRFWPLQRAGFKI